MLCNCLPELRWEWHFIDETPINKARYFGLLGVKIQLKVVLIRREWSLLCPYWWLSNTQQYCLTLMIKPLYTQKKSVHTKSIANANPIQVNSTPIYCPTLMPKPLYKEIPFASKRKQSHWWLSKTTAHKNIIEKHQHIRKKSILYNPV
jgi:hypothetical protein